MAKVMQTAIIKDIIEISHMITVRRRATEVFIITHNIINSPAIS